MSEESASSEQFEISMKEQQLSHTGEAAAEKAIEKENRLNLVIEEAQQAGMDQTALENLVQTLSSNDRPLLTNGVLATFRNLTGIEKDTLYRLAKAYAKEKIRAKEKGELYHYHQTSLDAFDSSGENGGLLSLNMLRLLGKGRSSSGSRPDVVQMTRDEYDRLGKLVKPGVEERSIGAQQSDITLVFGESVMDLPEYDCIAFYPNAPTVPYDNLAHVLIKDEADRVRAMQIIEKNNLQAAVTTKAEWIQRQYAGK